MLLHREVTDGLLRPPPLFPKATSVLEQILGRKGKGVTELSDRLAVLHLKDNVVRSLTVPVFEQIVLVPVAPREHACWQRCNTASATSYVLL